MKLPHHLADTALSQLFLESRFAQDVVTFSLPGGSTLYEAGEEADHIYFLRAGRLGAIRQDEGMDPQFLGVIRPGEPAGEMAMISGTIHSAKVVALRDSEILALPRAAFFRAAENDAKIMVQLARLMILRARQTASRAAPGAPSVFGFYGMSADVKAREQVEQIGHAIRRLGYSISVIGIEAERSTTEWFSNAEQGHDFILYVAEAPETYWKNVVGRQVDRLFLMGMGNASPDDCVTTNLPEPLLRQRLIDLILIQPADSLLPSGSETWLDRLPTAQLFHIRNGDEDHYARMARFFTGMAVGLVLSGGGARAYAHIGAIKALREAKTPIDFVCGTSMGAVIGAALAMGWDDQEIDWRIRKAFVDSSPLDDIAFPMIAMTRGLKVEERLEEHFGDTQIADLWLPFFCVSSNLTVGTYQLHVRGQLRWALRASISLPGILPPVKDGDNVLVDGGVMKNLPADVLRNMHRGPIVAVDVSRARGLSATDVASPPSLWRWFWSGQWRQGPPIVALLMRAGTVSTGRDLIASREASDVLVVPDLAGIDIRDWEAFDPATQAGYVATKAALERLHHPITDIGRRESRNDYSGA